MLKQPWHSKMAIWLLAGLVVACLLGASAAASLRPRRLQGHLDTVAYLLDRQQIAHGPIRVTQSYSGLLQRDAYAASIGVELPNGQEVGGAIECKLANSKCLLTIQSLGLMNELLPELDSPDQVGWLDWLQQQVSRLLPPR